MNLRIMVISSVVPNANGFGGDLVLHRYLRDTPNVVAKVVIPSKFPFRRKIFGKLRQMKQTKLSAGLETLWPVLPSAEFIDEVVEEFRPHLILTVAHGWWHVAAVDAAQRHGLRLVTFFQDWWSDFSEIPIVCRSLPERALRRTAARSDLVIGVSKGMLEHLGNPSNAIVIHDIPSSLEGALAKCEPAIHGPVFRTVYFGNLSDYGPMVEAALLAAEDSENLELHVYGPKPAWTAETERRARQQGRYHGSLPSSELCGKIGEYDAILITMRFEERHRRRMQTSFPSKLIEGTQFGLPLVIWGPKSCSAVRWGESSNAALCVTDPNPLALRDALARLAASPEEQDRLSAGAREAAATVFDRKAIQAQFVTALEKLVDPS